MAGNGTNMYAKFHHNPRLHSSMGVGSSWNYCYIFIFLQYYLYTDVHALFQINTSISTAIKSIKNLYLCMGFLLNEHISKNASFHKMRN
jgi:hypothetical protein